LIWSSHCLVKCTRMLLLLKVLKSKTDFFWKNNLSY
jgi:hypothetical protein